MDSHLDDDLAALPDLLAAVQQYAAGILAGIGDRPVAAPPAPPVPGEPLPRHGAGARAALDAFARRWGPGFSASAGPRYLGFVTGGSTPRPRSLATGWLVPSIRTPLLARTRPRTSWRSRPSPGCASCSA